MKCSTALSLPIFAGLLWLAQPADADPVENYSLIPSNRDKSYDAKLSRGMFELSRNGGVNRTVKAPLSPGDIEVFRRSSTKSVRVEQGAAPDLFADPSLFPNLQAVMLCDSHNDVYLQQLSMHYPAVRAISIRQEVPLNKSSIACLGRFNSLESLHLWCPLSGRDFAEALPKTICLLSLHDRVVLPELPALRWLGMYSCRLDEKFFDEIRAPNLQAVHLDAVDLAKGSGSAMGRFKLRQFVASRCHIDSSDLDGLAELPFLEVSVMNDWKRIDQNFQTAEDLYSKGEFQRAIPYYDASIFAKPSAKKYLKRARCLLALGLRDRAIQSCNYAKELDPSDNETDSVERQAIGIEGSPRP